MSEASINQVFKRIGYTGRVTVTASGSYHEHRSSCRTGYNTAWIETQLAHVDKNAIRGAPTTMRNISMADEMLQWYADYMVSLEKGGNVVQERLIGVGKDNCWWKKGYVLTAI